MWLCRQAQRVSASSGDGDWRVEQPGGHDDGQVRAAMEVHVHLAGGDSMKPKISRASSALRTQRIQCLAH